MGGGGGGGGTMGFPPTQSTCILNGELLENHIGEHGQLGQNLCGLEHSDSSNLSSCFLASNPGLPRRFFCSVEGLGSRLAVLS